MLSSVIKKTLDFYLIPLRFAHGQARRNLQLIKEIKSEIKELKKSSDFAIDQFFTLLSRDLRIDVANLSREQRLRQAQTALTNAEYGLSLAMSEALKALLLLAASDNRSLKTPPSGSVIDGQCETISRA